MPVSSIIPIAVAVVALAAVAGAFSIAWHRSIADDTGRGSTVDLAMRESERHRLVDLPEVPTEGSERARPTGAPHREPAATTGAPAETAVAMEERQRVIEVSPEEQGVTRRQFFSRALGATFFTFLGVLGLEFLAFLWPRIEGGFGADIVVGSIGDLLDKATNSDGTITPVFVPDARAYIVPAPETLPEIYQDKNVAAGGLFALWQRCVHLGCRVPWCQPSQGFECPCHGSKYSVIGEYFAGPAPRSLDRFVVEETEGGELLVKTGQIVQTPRLDRLNVSYPQGPFCVG